MLCHHLHLPQCYPLNNVELSVRCNNSIIVRCQSLDVIDCSRENSVALCWCDAVQWNTDIPFTRYNPVWQPCWTNRLFVQHGCQTGLYNRFDNRLYTRYSHLSNRLSNGFDNRLNVFIHNTTGNRFDIDNRLYCVYKHLPSCQTGLSAGCIV